MVTDLDRNPLPLSMENNSSKLVKKQGSGNEYIIISDKKIKEKYD